MIEEMYYPEVINPRFLRNHLQKKGIFIACKDIQGNTIWLVSPKRDFTRLRLREFWIVTDDGCKNVPWKKLVGMKIKFTGDYLVFVLNGFYEKKVSSERCTFYLELQAYVLNE